MTGCDETRERPERGEPATRPHLQISVHHKAGVHVLQPQDDLGGVEAHLLLRKHAVLRQVIVQVAPWSRRHGVEFENCCPEELGRSRKTLLCLYA